MKELILCFNLICPMNAIDIQNGIPVPPKPELVYGDMLPPAMFYFLGGTILMGATALYLHGR